MTPSQADPVVLAYHGVVPVKAGWVVLRWRTRPTRAAAIAPPAPTSLTQLPGSNHERTRAKAERAG
jgi:hypothetical protein